jgi:hypothetical protein
MDRQTSEGGEVNNASAASRGAFSNAGAITSVSGANDADVDADVKANAHTVANTNVDADVDENVNAIANACADANTDADFDSNVDINPDADANHSSADANADTNAGVDEVTSKKAMVGYDNTAQRAMVPPMHECLPSAHQGTLGPEGSWHTSSHQSCAHHPHTGGPCGYSTWPRPLSWHSCCDSRSIQAL